MMGVAIARPDGPLASTRMASVLPSIRAIAMCVGCGRDRPTRH